MPILSLIDLSIRFRGPNLLDDVSCRIEKGERIGLLGRNGAGKSTLIRLIAGEIEPDHGQILLEPGIRIARLEQDVPRDISGDVRRIVEQGLTGLGADWKTDHLVDQILTRTSLDGDMEFSHLSSGMKRRVLLARALVCQPELLLLDEPTNHLDIESIDWLETFLKQWSGAILFVTHDRTFLQNLATRILEIDRGQLLDWPCDYRKFLDRKMAVLEAEEKQNAQFDRRLAEEEAWIRQGIKARRKRNQGRVRRLQEMRQERSARRQKGQTAKLEIQAGPNSGNVVAKVEQISFAYPDRTIVRDFSTEISKGDRIGIIGPNGAGKTTLLKLLLGQLKPDQGQVRHGKNLQIAYFDQLRDTLNEEQTVQHNIADGYETVSIEGRTKHVLGYLKEFLFPPERAMSPVRFLSGGERNRLLLARLFAKPANVLVLDEPTNDLDAETLELLEEKLLEFPGTILLVSHDRTFLNNVVTSTLVFEDGNVREYDGGYDDWVRQSKKASGAAANNPPTGADNEKRPKTRSRRNPESARKLTWKETDELKKLPDAIENLEAQIAEIHQAMADPEFYKQPPEFLSHSKKELDELTIKLQSYYERWEFLENIAGPG